MDVQVLCEKYPGFLKDILNGLRQAIILTSLEGRVLDASEVVDAVTGFTPELLIGENLSLLFTAEDLEYLYPNLLFLGRRNKSYEGEVLLKKKKRSPFFCLPHASYLYGVQWRKPPGLLSPGYRKTKTIRKDTPRDPL